MNMILHGVHYADFDIKQKTPLSIRNIWLYVLMRLSLIRRFRHSGAANPLFIVMTVLVCMGTAPNGKADMAFIAAHDLSVGRRWHNGDCVAAWGVV